MFPASPASVIPISVWSPLETLKPPNSITASLGIGMQALPAAISRKIPARPVLSITLTQKSTIGPVMSAIEESACAKRGL